MRELVYEQLTEASHRTILPRLIVADHGSDVKSGIEKFCEEHETVSFVYDVKHAMARLLKALLKKNEK